MNATAITVITENLDTLTGLDRTLVENLTAATFASLDLAEQCLRAFAAEAGWFVYRGGNHVALHRVSGGARVLLVAERPIEAPAPAPTFATIKAAVSCARDEARDEAKQHMRNLNDLLIRKRGQRAIRLAFVRSRGQAFVSSSETAGRAGAFEEQAEWDGTKRDLLNAIAKCEADLRCDTLDLCGGFDISETIDFDDYEPEVSSWSVTVWTRAEGLVCKVSARDRE